MENETSTEQPHVNVSNEQAGNGNSAKSKRSASYPAFTVEKAYDLAVRINDKFGNQEFTRKELAHILQVHPNTISRDVAAVYAYGFLDKNSSKKTDNDTTYALNAFFQDTFRPENENHRKLNFMIAFAKPKLFKDLIVKFDTTVIPNELPNTLIKHHGITESAAKEVAELFIKAGRSVGVIKDNRLLDYKVSVGVMSKSQYVDYVDLPSNQDDTEPVAKEKAVIKMENLTYESTSDKKIPIHLTKDKVAYLAYPADISSKDIKLIEHQVAGILLRLELEQEDDPKNEKGQN